MVWNIFYVHPENWGRFPIWRAYFSKGWFNHQPVISFISFHSFFLHWGFVPKEGVGYSWGFSSCSGHMNLFVVVLFSSQLQRALQADLAGRRRCRRKRVLLVLVSLRIEQVKTSWNTLKHEGHVYFASEHIVFVILTSIFKVDHVEGWLTNDVYLPNLPNIKS